MHSARPACYNLDTRTTIVNRSDRSGISSRTEGVKKNSDGSVNLFFGHIARSGIASWDEDPIYYPR